MFVVDGQHLVKQRADRSHCRTCDKSWVYQYLNFRGAPILSSHILRAAVAEAMVRDDELQVET